MEHLYHDVGNQSTPSVSNFEKIAESQARELVGGDSVSRFCDVSWNHFRIFPIQSQQRQSEKKSGTTRYASTPSSVTKLGSIRFVFLSIFIPEFLWKRNCKSPGGVTRTVDEILGTVYNSRRLFAVTVSAPMHDTEHGKHRVPIQLQFYPEAPPSRIVILQEENRDEDPDFLPKLS